MTCRQAFPLLSAERDRPLAPEERGRLEAHLAGCEACRALRAELSTAAQAWAASTAAAPAPAPDPLWRDVQRRIRDGITSAPPVRPAWPRVAAWAGAPLAAAALALVFWFNRPTAPATSIALPRADYVEAGDARASTVVYLDQDSGWLIVWAAPASR